MKIDYDESAKELTVRAEDGTEYRYCNVSVVAFNFFKHSENVAAYWKKHIDPVYVRKSPCVP